jgi:Sulfatase
MAAAPDGAPNILLILLDDIGFGHASTFGGPVNTPTLQRTADDGLRYNRFHTTALCSPTHAALLTGRNHHSVHTGCITELARVFPATSCNTFRSREHVDEGVFLPHGSGDPIAEATPQVDDLDALAVDGDSCPNLLTAGHVAAKNVGNLPVPLVDISTNETG